MKRILIFTAALAAFAAVTASAKAADPLPFPAAQIQQVFIATQTVLPDGTMNNYFAPGSTVVFRSYAVDPKSRSIVAPKLVKYFYVAIPNQPPLKYKYDATAPGASTGLPWTAPSPNMPNLASAALYPGLACFEFTNLSVGRGTPEPFNWIGAPWMKAEELARTLNAALLEGVEFEPKDYTPSKSEYAGQLCHGVRVIVKNRDAARPWLIFVHMIAALRELNPQDFQPNWKETRKLIGTDRFQTLYEKGESPSEIVRQLEPDDRAFESARRPFLLYQ